MFDITIPLVILIILSISIGGWIYWLGFSRRKIENILQEKEQQLKDLEVQYNRLEEENESNKEYANDFRQRWYELQLDIMELKFKLQKDPNDYSINQYLSDGLKRDPRVIKKKKSEE